MRVLALSVFYTLVLIVEKCGMKASAATAYSGKCLW